MPAFCGVDGAPSSVEQTVVFQKGDGGHDGIHGAPSCLEDGSSLFQRGLESGPVGLLLLLAELFRVEMSCAAVDGQGPCAFVRRFGGAGLNGGSGALGENQHRQRPEKMETHVPKVGPSVGREPCLILGS